MNTNDLEKELEQEYERFIEFGNLLDKRMRTYIVQYIKNKFQPNRYVIPTLNEQYFEYFQHALDRIFLIEGLKEVTQYNHRLRNQVVLDILYWLRKAYKKSKLKNPYHDEKQRLEGWAVTPFKVFINRWVTLPTYLSTAYQRSELDYLFFQEKFKTLIKAYKAQEQLEQQTEKQQQIEVLFEDLLAQWDALLYAKILAFQLAKFEEEQETFVDFISQKVYEYNKIRDLINPFSEYLGWDMSRQLWQETSFDIIKHYNELLKDEKSVKELADLLGNLREAEIEIEEEEFERTIIRQEWVVDELSKSEIVGVKESNDLTNMLSSEALMMSDMETESLFLKKYVDKKLMTFRYEDRKLVTSEDHYTEINQRVNQKEKGPFIICVDTSESMHGKPELIAKVLTLSILKMAMNQNRRAFLINFSTGIQTLDLHDIANSIENIAAFLRKSFYGGTDATLAFYEAIKQLDRNEYEDADILMVSDFIMSKMDDDVFQKIRFYQQNKNTQFHCLILGKSYNENVLSIFDTNWIYNPKEKGIIRALTEGFRTIKERY